jgi:G3E family GTPase
MKTGPIASMFWLNEEYSVGLRKQISLDGVVCVVDAAFGQQVNPSMNPQKA